MAKRYYSAIAVDNTVASSISSSATTVTLSSSPVGFPGSYPYVVAIDYNSASEELVLVTAAAGFNLTISRADAGLGSNTVGTAVSHNAGAVVRHVITAQDMTEAATHVYGTGAVHGLTGGSVVGTIDSQTLTNKTISGSSNTITNVPISTAVSGLGTGVATFLATPTSANLLAAVSDETGTGSLVFGTSPSITTPKTTLGINANTGTAYTLVLTDQDKMVTLNNAAAITLTVPSAIFSAGQYVNIQAIGVGQVTVQGDGTSTVTGTGTKLRTQYSAATVLCTASNTFQLIGDLA
jgi:hypothetical protein